MMEPAEQLQTETPSQATIDLIGRVVLIHELLKDNMSVNTLVPGAKQRGIDVSDLVIQSLSDGTSVQIGVVKPSEAETRDATSARHPSSSPMPHYEIWHQRKDITDNYRLYGGPTPKVLKPKSERRTRQLNPDKSDKNWSELLRIIISTESAVGIKSKR